MYKIRFNTGKGNRICLALTKPYRPAKCRGELSSSLTGGEKEQTVLKVVVKLAVGTHLLKKTCKVL